LVYKHKGRTGRAPIAPSNSTHSINCWRAKAEFGVRIVVQEIARRAGNQGFSSLAVASSSAAWHSPESLLLPLARSTGPDLVLPTEGLHLCESLRRATPARPSVRPIEPPRAHVRRWCSMADFAGKSSKQSRAPGRPCSSAARKKRFKLDIIVSCAEVKASRSHGPHQT